MKKKNRTSLVLALLALAATQTRAQNLVTNGSFEIPAYPGSGDIYSTNPGFTLPGWGYASSNLFVEYGKKTSPTGKARYADGRQAVCLDDNGLGGAQIWQTINAVPGQNYVLSFAQADASMDPGTVSQVTVTLESLELTERTFSRTNDGPGYTVKTWHFTADTSHPTLYFHNTTTNGLPEISPFLDAISIIPASLLLVGTNMYVPNGAGHFGQLPRGPGVWGSNFVFFGTGPGFQQGIYGTPQDPIHPADPIKIADLNTPIPGGTGNFIRFSGLGGTPGGYPGDPITPPDPCISGNHVVFAGFGDNNQQGIYAFPVDPIFPGDPIKIADFNTPVPPGGLGNFGLFIIDSLTPPDPCISGNTVAFYGAGGDLRGIYTATLDGALTRIADTTTSTPGNTEGDHFIAFYPDPFISGNSVVFSAMSGNGSNSITPGVYLSTEGGLARVADNSIANPEGTGRFSSFESPDALPLGPRVSGGGNVLFWARNTDGNQGLYVKYPQDPIYPGDPMMVVANTQTPIPGGSSNFTGFSAMSLSWDTVAFVGLGAGGQMGIYVSYPSDPITPNDPVTPVDPMYKVIDLNDTLDGKTITNLNLSRTGLDRDRNLLAFGATFSDGTQGLYTINVFTGLRITSMAKAGPDLQLNFTSQLGHNYTVQSRADLASGTWSDLLTQIPGNGLTTQATVSNAFVAPKQFYRIEQEQ